MQGGIVRFTIAAIASCLCLTWAGQARAQESNRYRMERIGLSAASGRATALDYQTTLVAGEDSPAGSASLCNDSFQLGLGYWSNANAFPVPVLLRLAKLPGDSPELTWTGAAIEFHVYRSEMPIGLIKTTNLFAQTPACSEVDDISPTGDIVFYKVIPKPGTQKDDDPQSSPGGTNEPEAMDSSDRPVRILDAGPAGSDDAGRD